MTCSHGHFCGIECRCACQDDTVARTAVPRYRLPNQKTLPTPQNRCNRQGLAEHDGVLITVEHGQFVADTRCSAGWVNRFSASRRTMFQAAGVEY